METRPDLADDKTMLVMRYRAQRFAGACFCLPLCSALSALTYLRYIGHLLVRQSVIVHNTAEIHLMHNSSTQYVPPLTHVAMPITPQKRTLGEQQTTGDEP